MSAYDEWSKGDLEDGAVIHALAMDLGEVESDIKPLEKQREDLRDKISQVMYHYGHDMIISGFGKIEMTAGFTGHRYDTGAIDQIISELRDSGNEELAKYIEMARLETSRAGSLRITREKGSK